MVALEPVDSNAEIQAAVSLLLASIRSWDWTTFEGRFDQNAVILTEVGEPPSQHVQNWAEAAPVLRQLFSRARSVKAPLLASPIAFRDLTFDIRGAIAMVGVRSRERRQSRRVLVLALVGGRWLVRHLNTTALGLGGA